MVFFCLGLLLNRYSLNFLHLIESKRFSDKIVIMTSENGVHLTIELTGVAKDIAGQKEIQMQMASHDTYHDVVEKLAELYPNLVNILIAPDKKTFLSSNLFIINDEMTEPVFVMEKHPRDGDRLTLLSVMTGG